MDSKNINLSEPCNHDPSEMNVETPLSMLEKLGVGDGSINNEQISEEEILVVPKDFTSIQNKHNICLVCKEPGQLICCCGKGCKRSYHLSCFNPLLHDVPPGAWLCYFCVKKKMDLGAHSVSNGIESVWDVDEGMQNGKQYFVKYKGLAHVHNRWIPESELLHDAPSLFASFGKNAQKEGYKWRKEWIEPERLLQKRLVVSVEVADELTSVSMSEPLSCCVEWFVKWKGLEYDQATWELENLLLLNSSDFPMLIKDYECRREQASRSYDPLRADKALQVKRDPFCKMSKLPDECPVELDNDHLSSVNCLREFWYKSVNALFIDGQERISKSIIFVLSLHSHACRPSLIITTSGSLQLWQAGFLRLAPSVNVLVYHGDKDVRRMLRSLEFYDECGRLMFQVLLADPKAITEDLVNIAFIGWESIIVDECQNSKIMGYLEQLNTLNTDFKLLLFNGELKDILSEHRVLLSFLDSEGTMDNELVGLKANSSDAPFVLTKLKEKLARHIAFDSKTDSTKFLEYWVPVPLSSVQLEQYCSTLVSNATVLRSNLRSDVVEALHNILITTRKCCDHPYLVDGDLRGLLTKGLQGAEFLNAEVCASGKLYLLGKILQDMKDRGLRVVILFQSLGGPEKVYLGDVLDDFLLQRFGVDTYERIETGIATTKKFAALKKFNNKEPGKFVFLIEKRACLPSVKLHSVDAIILFNSDWNPLNDLRSLQKINVESQYKCTRVFRFYTSYTVEEKLLMLSKDIILESCVENISRNITHLLLSWGTSYLFQKLDHLHSSAKPASITEPSFDKLCLNDVIMEILTQFPGKTETSRPVPCSILARAQLCGGTYSRNIVLASEKEGIFLPDKDLSSFWSGLLEGRHPQWMYISEHSQRVRRRIQNSNGLAIQAVEGDEIKSKRRKIDSNVDPVKLDEINKEKEDGPEENRKSCMLESEDGKQQLEDQRNLLMLLRPELSELCDILGQPEFVKDMAQKFLLYIMTNHDVSTNRVTVLQALKISLCWRAASMSGHSLDRCGSLSVAKKHLKFECTDEEAYSVYSKLQILEEKFPCQTGALENLSVEKSLDNRSPSKIVNDVREALDWRAMDTEATGNLTAGVADGYKASEQLISLQSHPIGERPPGMFQPDFGSYNENPSNILNQQEENVRPGDVTLGSCILVRGDDLEQIVQNRLSVETTNCPGQSSVLSMDSGISAAQSAVFKPFSSCPADLINGSVVVECFNFKQQECRADSNVQLGPNPEPKQAVNLTSVQGLTSYVPASTLSSMQGLCTNKHSRPSEALTKDNDHDIDSAQDVTVTASDSVVNLSPHIEMMTCNDVAPSNSTNVPLPQAEHEQERFPPTGYQEATPQPHHSVELSEVPAQHEIVNVAVESNPSNSQIPENAIQPLRPQEYLPSEGIPSEHLGNTVIQYGMACDWSHSSTQQAEVTVEAAVSEVEPSIQQIPENNLHPMRPHEDLQFERTHSEHLGSTDIQLDEPSQFFQNFSSMEWVPPQAIFADPISNELIRVQRQDISFTKQHEKKKLLLQSRCEEEIEKVRRKYDILLQDDEKEYHQEKNKFHKIYQKICWHKAFAEDVSSNFYDHKKGSSSPFQVPSQNSSQHPQASCLPPQLTTRPSSASPPVLLSTLFQPPTSQTTEQASTPHFLPISRPQASSTGLTTHTSPFISSDRVGGRINPRGILQISPINLRPNLHAGRSPAPHLQRGRSPQTSDPTLNTPVASVATLQPTPPSLVSTASPVVPPPILASFPAPFPFVDSSILNTFGNTQPAGFEPAPLYFGIPQLELPHNAEPDDGLLESLLANFPAAEANAEALMDSRPTASSDFIYLSDEG